MNTDKGFTLLEMVLAVALSSALLVVVISGWNSLGRTEKKMSAVKQKEFNYYRMYRGMAAAINCFSDIVLDLDGNRCPFFVGKREFLTFLTRSPLKSRIRGLHFVRFNFADSNLYYAESRLTGPIKLQEKAIRFTAPKVLAESVRSLDFSYCFFDLFSGKMVWKNETDSRKGGEIPWQVLLRFTTKKEKREYRFFPIIGDIFEKIPARYVQ